MSTEETAIQVEQPEYVQNLEVPVVDQEIEKYQYGDLWLKCYQCNTEYPIDKLISNQHGIQVILVPQSNSKLNLVCQNCQARIELYWKGSPQEEIDAHLNELEQANKIEEDATAEEISKEE